MTTEIAFALAAMIISLTCATFSGVMAVRARRRRIQAQADLETRTRARQGCVTTCEPDCNGATLHHDMAVLADLGQVGARKIIDQYNAGIEALVEQIVNRPRHDDLGNIPNHVSITRVRRTCDLRSPGGTCICARVVNDQIRRHHQTEDGDK